MAFLILQQSQDTLATLLALEVRQLLRIQLGVGSKWKQTTCYESR